MSERISYQPQIPPHVVNSARGRGVTFTGSVFPEQRSGYSHTPARRLAQETAASAATRKEDQ